MKFLAVFVAVLAVSAAAPRFSTWDANELAAAINDPSTDAALVPYLIDSLNNLMEAIWSGSPITAIPVVTPAGVVPSPADASAVVPEVAPVAPAAVSEASSGSPLVQIIVNVNAGSQSAVGANPDTPAAVGESIEGTPVSPVAVVDQPAVTPVVVVDQPAVTPVVVVDQPAVSPVVVVDQPAVSPVVVVEKPAIVVEPETVEPITVGEPALPIVVAPINPIDVIAVAAPEVNPVDIISPVPAVAGGLDTGILV